MFIFGLASIITLPSLNLMMNIGLTTIGVLLIACGSCCEAYRRGNLVGPSKVTMQRQRSQHEDRSGFSTRVTVNPAELEEQKAHAY